MKLYAAVTSERATKFQGGQKFIEVYINDSNGCMVAKLTITVNKDSVGEITKASVDFAEHVYVNGNQWLGAEITKGEKQKDEIVRDSIIDTYPYEK